MMSKLGIQDIGVICALGQNKADVAQHLFANQASPGVVKEQGWMPEQSVYVAKSSPNLSALPDHLAHFDCRNNRLLKHAADEIKSALDELTQQYSRDRIAVIIGSSTSGILEGEQALAYQQHQGTMPDNFHYRQQEIGTSALFLKQYLSLEGLAFTLSTACSSSAKVFASAQRLIDSGLCDAAIVGGADSLCRLTINGFSALESVSSDLCNPMGAGRDGITIGEGAALFILNQQSADIQLMAAGESSDAHHISAPQPDGLGAEAAMRAALQQANIAEQDIDYLNMHGTATQKNDAMESKAIARVFGTNLPCSSTKALIGHSLGAAGALEAALLWLTLSHYNSERRLPPHIFAGEQDPQLPALNLTTTDKPQFLPDKTTIRLMSNSFAFGGSNASLILGTGGNE